MAYWMALEELDRLLAALTAREYRVIGPTVRDGATVYDEIASAADLPAGWTDAQEGGTYRLIRRDDGALFGYNSGPISLKQFLFPPGVPLVEVASNEDGFEAREPSDEPPAYAFVGVRACDLAAVAVQDKVFLRDPYVDPVYRRRRERAFFVAVQCTQAGRTCFCASMGTGPRAHEGFDLALTEVVEEGRHYFLVEVGTDHGAAVFADIPHRDASDEEIATARQAVERIASQMGRALDTRGIKELLYANYDHPRWDDVASRCLACTNCTMVCPTCFCTAVEDSSDLDGTRAGRERRWDSCFTGAFSYIHGGGIRPSVRSRYRQWLVHKLGTWIDQFGTSGCVGCGRCITWCPVGIDLTAEVAAIRGVATSEEGQAHGGA